MDRLDKHKNSYYVVNGGMYSTRLDRVEGYLYEHMKHGLVIYKGKGEWKIAEATTGLHFPNCDPETKIRIYPKTRKEAEELVSKYMEKYIDKLPYYIRSFKSHCHKDGIEYPVN